MRASSNRAHDDPRPILVTGATGTVGRHVVAGLRARGVPVRAAVRDPARAETDDAELVRLDFTDPGTFDAAFDGVRACFLMRPPQIANVGATVLPALEAARRAGVERIAFLSLQGVERNRFVPHRRIEDDLRRSGPPWTMLRAGFFLQNLIDPHGRDVAEHDELYLPAGGGRTAFVDARDVAEVAVRSLTEPGHEHRAYELTGRTALTYAEVAEILTNQLGRRIRYVDATPWGFWRRFRRRGHAKGQVAVMLALYTACRFGLAAHVSDDLASVLGREPTPIEAFVRDHANAWRPSGSTSG